MNAKQIKMLEKIVSENQQAAGMVTVKEMISGKSYKVHGQTRTFDRWWPAAAKGYVILYTASGEQVHGVHVADRFIEA